MRGPGSIPTGGNILSLDFFHTVKPPMPILALLPMLCVCENPDFKHAKIKTHVRHALKMYKILDFIF